MTTELEVKIANVNDLPNRRVRAPRSWTRPQEHRDLAVSHPWYRTVFRLQTEIAMGTLEFFGGRGYAAALMPVTCHSISSPMGLGSDSEPVAIDLHGEQVYLADSMQFHLEYLLRQGVEGTFYLMPTFRGEDSDATHLNEFFHSEAEIRGGLDDVMQLVMDYAHFLTQRLLVNCSDEIAAVTGKLAHLEALLALNKRLPVIRYEEAKELLAGDASHFKALPGDLTTISRAGEQYLLEHVSPFLWISHPPHAQVPFYQAWNGDGEHALCADLLFGIGEVVGCGERNIDEVATLRSLQAHNVDPKAYDWYLHMKKQYPMRTAGFGLGLERFLLWVLQHDDIRDLQIFTRLKGMSTCL